MGLAISTGRSARPRRAVDLEPRGSRGGYRRSPGADAVQHRKRTARSAEASSFPRTPRRRGIASRIERNCPVRRPGARAVSLRRRKPPPELLAGEDIRSSHVAAHYEKGLAIHERWPGLKSLARILRNQAAQELDDAERPRSIMKTRSAGTRRNSSAPASATAAAAVRRAPILPVCGSFRVPRF
jgi:hypothetical protein